MKRIVLIRLLFLIIAIQIQLILGREKNHVYDWQPKHGPNCHHHHHHYHHKQPKHQKDPVENLLAGRELAARDQKVTPPQLQDRIDALQMQLGQLQTMQGQLPMLTHLDNRLKELESMLPQHTTLQKHLLDDLTDMKKLHQMLMQQFESQKGSVKELQKQIQILELELVKLKDVGNPYGNPQQYGTMYIPISHFH